MSDLPTIEAKREAYLAFLRSKIPKAEQSGFEPPSPCHPSLYPHQRDICEWACRGGRRAVFANFGLGKSRMDIQLGIWITQQTGGRYLIVAPLGVRQEFTLSDGPAMGVQIQYISNGVARASLLGYIAANEQKEIEQIKANEVRDTAIPQAIAALEGLLECVDEWEDNGFIVLRDSSKDVEPTKVQQARAALAAMKGEK